MRFGHLLVAGAALAAVVAFDARDAHACGGCFPPPGEAQSVVTDHRMVLSVSQQQTTLYDQIRYTGNPSSFAWVLPIAGTVNVGLSADTVFQTLENLTQTTVQSPPTGCPGRTDCTEEATASDRAGPISGSSGSSGGVDVLKQETVGPYATVQLRSTDPQALDTWLTTNGFAIPAEVKPVIAAYVGEKFDFLALKLLPGKDVTSMRPVRVTTSGAAAVLPLRMVAAGTGANVGVALWVVGEGRYEPQNFPFFTLRSEDLTWDWATNTSNYKELRAAKTTELAGKGWEVESSIDIDRTQFESVLSRIGNFNGQGSDYAEIEENGQLVKTADQVRREDMEAFFSGLQNRTRITRTRADLAKAALATDLVMIASGDQSVLSNLRQPKLEKGQPTCTVYSGCTAVGTAPRDEAIARSNGPTETFSCKSAARRLGANGFATLGGIAALAGIVLVRARRKRG